MVDPLRTTCGGLAAGWCVEGDSELCYNIVFGRSEWRPWGGQKREKRIALRPPRGRKPASYGHRPHSTKKKYLSIFLSFSQKLKERTPPVRRKERRKLTRGKNWWRKRDTDGTRAEMAEEELHYEEPSAKCAEIYKPFLVFGPSFGPSSKLSLDHFDW